MNKSSIEWLEERLTLSFGDDIKSLRGFFVIAKEMHKDELDESYQEGYQNGHEAAMSYIKTKEK